jgi:hypothetical protein
MNHGTRFWRLVDRLVGENDAQAAQSWLRENGTELHRYNVQRPKRRRAAEQCLALSPVRARRRAHQQPIEVGRIVLPVSADRRHRQAATPADRRNAAP